MAVAVRSGVVYQYRNIELADLIVERPEFLSAEIGVLEPTHNLHRPEAKRSNRSIDLAARLLDVGKKNLGDADVLLRMGALFQVLGDGVVVRAGKLATQVAVPGVKQLAVLRNQHVDVESLPVDMLIPCIQ